MTTAGQGMRVTWKYLAQPREIITVQYPKEKLPIPAGYRGRLVNDVPRCVSCDLCAQNCPPGCITVKWETGPDKKRILTSYEIDMTICLYCGLCTEVCPTECLTMDGGYDSSAKEEIAFTYLASGGGSADSAGGLRRARAEEKRGRKKPSEPRQSPHELMNLEPSSSHSPPLLHSAAVVVAPGAAHLPGRHGPSSVSRRRRRDLRGLGGAVTRGPAGHSLCGGVVVLFSSPYS